MLRRTALVLLALAIGPLFATAPGEAAFLRPIRGWVLHYDRRLTDEVLPAYADLLDALPDDTEVFFAVEVPEDADSLTARLGLDDAPDRRVHFLDSEEPLTGWARDRYVVFARDGRGYLLAPPPDVDLSGGDRIAARKVAHAFRLEPAAAALALEGGNVLLTDDLVVVGAGAVLDNLHRCGGRADLVVDALEACFGRRALVIGDDAAALPHEHADMYLAAVGPRTFLLGDPRLAFAYFDALAELGIPEGDVRGIGEFRREQQERAAASYDRVAAQLEHAGFEVERVPVLHSADDEVVTWTNAVLEQRGAELHAYVPCYGIPLLDRLAHATWKRLGYEVHPIRTETIIRHGGAVRCLTNCVR